MTNYKLASVAFEFKLSCALPMHCFTSGFKIRLSIHIAVKVFVLIPNNTVFT